MKLPWWLQQPKWKQKQKEKEKPKEEVLECTCKPWVLWSLDVLWFLVFAYFGLIVILIFQTFFRRVRLYYCTRTHKQITQVIKEFARLSYGFKLK